MTPAALDLPRGRFCVPVRAAQLDCPRMPACSRARRFFARAPRRAATCAPLMSDACCWCSTRAVSPARARALTLSGLAAAVRCEPLQLGERALLSRDRRRPSDARGRAGYFACGWRARPRLSSSALRALRAALLRAVVPCSRWAASLRWVLDAGQKIGAYGVVAKLREGGMATLFLAAWLGRPALRVHVAIKVVHPSLANDEQFRQMFLG